MSDTGPSDPNGGSLDTSSYEHLGQVHVPSKPGEETDNAVLNAGNEPEPLSSLSVAEEKDRGSSNATVIPSTEETLPQKDPNPEEETSDKGTLNAGNSEIEITLPDDAEGKYWDNINTSPVPSTEKILPKEEPGEESGKSTLKTDNFERESSSFLGVTEKDDDTIKTAVVQSTEEMSEKKDSKLEEETLKGALKADDSENELPSSSGTTKDGDTTNISLFLSDSPSHEGKEVGISPFLQQEKKTDLKTDKRADSDNQDVDHMALNSSDHFPNEPAHVQPKNDVEIDLEDKKIKQEPIWVQEKDKCLAESIEERRKKRKCTELSSIKTWPEYYRLLKPEYDIAEPDHPDISNKISIWTGDITSLLVDAIVNAANETLMGGGGVDGAIHSAAGPLLKEECKKFKGCRTGEAVITGGYNLPAKYVIHTVGPRGENPHELGQCYLNSLQRLIEEKQRTIAFPCISTGIFGYPNDKAAEVVAGIVNYWLKENHEKVDRVIFCLFLEKDVHFYEQHLQVYFPMSGSRPVGPYRCYLL